MNQAGKHFTSGGIRRRHAGGTSATAALGLALALCVAAAVVLVYARTGEQRRLAAQMAAGRERGAAVIAQIKEKGLTAYVDDEAEVFYYLITVQGQPVGFSAFVMGPTQAESGQTIVKGSRLRYLPTEGRIEIHDFEAADDLSWFEHGTEFHGQRFRGGRLMVRYRWEQGVLAGPYVSDTQEPGVRTREFDPPNLIPVELVDLFSSIALQEAEAPAAFLVVFGQAGALSADECLVARGGEIPAEVAAERPGAAMTALWAESATRQSLYYSASHELIWQREEYGPGYTKQVVPQGDVLEAFPRSRELIETWLAQMGITEEVQTI